MRSVSVSGLKARLSEYLRHVRAGERVVVTDRGLPVAVLVPSSEVLLDPEIRALVEAGLIRPGLGYIPDDFWEHEGPPDPEGGVLKALLEERESGR